MFPLLEIMTTPKSLTEQLLLFLADYLDLHRRFTCPSLIGAIAGDPRLRKHRKLMERYLKDRRRRQRFSKAIYDLKRRGYLQEQVLQNARGYVLSPLGERKVYSFRLRGENEQLKLPAGQWLMVFFDIPEEKRHVRDAFRSGLRRLYFEPLQRSVWVTRYRVSRELGQLIRLLKVEAFAKPLLVHELPGTSHQP